MSFVSTFIGIFVAAVVLTIAYKVFRAKCYKNSSSSEQYTLPVHRAQQDRPVSQPLPPPAPLSQSYRLSSYIPPVHQPPPSPHPPPPPQSYQSYTPPVHQLEQHQPVSQPTLSPRPPPPSYQPSFYTFPVHQPEQHQPVYQSPSSSRPPPPSQSYQSSPYAPTVYQPEQHQPVSQPSPHQPPLSQSSQPSPDRPPSPHGPPKHENQQDRPNDHYDGLRARAKKEGDEMARCFKESREVYSRGDRAAAKVLHFSVENNRDRTPGEIDLHGLYVKEAIAYTDTALKEAKLRGDSEIRLIVGKGSHSEGGEAILRPAIKGLMHKYQLVAEFDPSNSGVLIVKLNECPPIRHRQHPDNSHRRSHRRGRRASNIGA
ncbi:hypothetical protein F5146DRAFT_1006865 [Armillaria mellea]|nr:hypothetical protein F5146DRAFT_1006865 [Armillaria mellea]